MVAVVLLLRLLPKRRDLRASIPINFNIDWAKINSIITKKYDINKIREQSINILNLNANYIQELSHHQLYGLVASYILLIENNTLDYTSKFKNKESQDINIFKILKTIKNVNIQKIIFYIISNNNHTYLLVSEGPEEINNDIHTQELLNYFLSEEIDKNTNISNSQYNSLHL